MKILWFVRGEVTQEGKHLSSTVASVRYRVLAAARHLHNSGHQAQFLTLGKGLDCFAFKEVLKPDVLVISKSPYNSSVEPARFAKAHGARIILDVCDNYFEDPQSRDSFLALFEIADRVVASTTAMSEIIQQKTGRDSVVIDDPYEAPLLQPKFQPSGDRVRVVWFGGLMNRLTLADMIPSLVELSSEIPLLFHVVTDSGESNIREYLQNLTDQFGPGLITEFSEWDIDVTWRAIQNCDVVVVPSRPKSTYLVKSPNRVVEPLRMGRFVAAYPLPSYQQLGDYTWLGENVADGIRWAVSHPQEALAKIVAGQKYVTEKFMPEKIARRWEQEILSVASSRQVPSSPKFLKQSPVSQHHRNGML